MFERAARLKLRYETNVGHLSAEDLWDIKLADLDTLAVSLNNRLKNDNVSFINAVKPDELIQLRFDIVKHVIEVRLAERDAATEAREKAAKKQKILGIMARRQDEKLEQASEEELQGLLASL